MRKLIFLAIMIVGCASIAAAQSDYNKVEVYGGYSHARVDTGISDNDPALDDIFDEREGFNGFNAAVTGNVTRYLGFKFDVSGHFKQKTFPVGFIAASVDVDSTVCSFLGGVQLKDNSTETKFKPFAHALVGAAHARNEFEFSDNFCVAIFPSPCPGNFTETDTGLAGAFGGGIDIRAGKRFDIRVIQIDYVPTRVFDATQHNFRIGAGVVFR
jgi:Outer membrane protein beta-barrel domain